MEQGYDLLYKVCLLGDSGVGKSCLLRRFVDGVYSEKFMPTVGAEFGTKTLDDDGKVVKLHVWDTAGQERFRSLTANTIRGTHGAVFVFDVTDRESFLAVGRIWMAELDAKVASDRVIRLLVGNKSDLTEKRAVSFQEAQEFASAAGMPFVETSAKDGVNVQTAFQMLVTTIRSAAGEQPPTEDDRANIRLPDARPKRGLCRCG